MKKSIKILSVLLAFIMVLQCSVTAFASTASVSKYTGSTYTHQSQFDGAVIINGIDVSEHNGAIDFNKVKADGIDYVFIRVGYTGYTKSKHSLNFDKNYETYFANAQAAGLDVGVYWYSQALNEAEAIAEANKTLEAIQGRGFNLPVVFDYEYAGTPDGRLDSAHLSKAQMTNNVLAYLNTISAAGYSACVYSNPSFIGSNYDLSRITASYPLWLAHYTTNTNFNGPFSFWQYSSDGRVNGISGRVDMNFYYYRGSKVLPDQYYTGLPLTPEPVVVANGQTLVKDIDYTLSYTNNVNVGTGMAEVIGIGVYAGFTEQYTFKILPAPITDFVNTAKSRTSMTVTWSAVPGATNYLVYGVNNLTGKTFTKTSATTSVTLHNMTAGNTYSLYVSAGVGNGTGGYIWGPGSNVITVTTLGAKTGKLKASSSTTSTIKLTWGKVTGAKQYKIYKYNTSSKKYTLAGTASSNTYTVKKLSAGKSYKFKVSAVVGGIEAEKSDPLKAATNPKKPAKVSLSSAKSTSRKKITARWKKTTCTGYQVQWSTSKSFKSNYKTKTVSGSKNTSKTVTTAQARKTYYVRVRAYNKANGKTTYGTWSKVIKVKTR